MHTPAVILALPNVLVSLETSNDVHLPMACKEPQYAELLALNALYWSSFFVVILFLWMLCVCLCWVAMSLLPAVLSRRKMC
jgi:hypothetical protein